MRQHYTEEEANEILRRAVERQVGAGGMSRTQLEAIAGEIGVSTEALDRAEEEWLTEHEETGLRKAFNAERRVQWRSDLATYIAVNAFLVLLNRLMDPEFMWAYVVMLCWGLGVVLDALKILHPAGDEYEAEYRKWLAKRVNRALKSGQADQIGEIGEVGEVGDSGPYPYARP